MGKEKRKESVPETFSNVIMSSDRDLVTTCACNCSCSYFLNYPQKQTLVSCCCKARYGLASASESSNIDHMTPSACLQSQHHLPLVTHHAYAPPSYTLPAQLCICPHRLIICLAFPPLATLDHHWVNTFSLQLSRLARRTPKPTS